MTNEALFGGRSFAALLFDMDGTLLSSIESAERVWTAWALRHGLDVAAFLPTIHGVRAVETIRRQGLAGVDAEAEAAQLTIEEMADMDGVRPIGGVVSFLASLPADRWAIVTSAPRALALLRLEAAGLPVPAVFVTAEDVTNGKPRPDCYQLAARMLGVAAEDCLVFEDAPAGIEAGERAGAAVLVIRATHSHPLPTEHAAVDTYVGLSVVRDGAGAFTLVAEAHTPEPVA